MFRKEKSTKTQADRKQLTKIEKTLSRTLLSKIMQYKNTEEFYKIIQESISDGPNTFGTYAKKLVEAFEQEMRDAFNQKMPDGYTTYATMRRDMSEANFWYIVVLFKLFDYFNQEDSSSQDQIRAITDHYLSGYFTVSPPFGEKRNYSFKTACLLYNSCLNDSYLNKIFHITIMERLNRRMVMPDFLSRFSNEKQFFGAVLAVICQEMIKEKQQEDVAARLLEVCRINGSIPDPERVFGQLYTSIIQIDSSKDGVTKNVQELKKRIENADKLNVLNVFYVMHFFSNILNLFENGKKDPTKDSTIQYIPQQCHDGVIFNAYAVIHILDEQPTLEVVANRLLDVCRINGIIPEWQSVFGQIYAHIIRIAGSAGGVLENVQRLEGIIIDKIKADWEGAKGIKLSENILDVMRFLYVIFEVFKKEKPTNKNIFGSKSPTTQKVFSDLRKVFSDLRKDYLKEDIAKRLLEAAEKKNTTSKNGQCFVTVEEIRDGHGQSPAAAVEQQAVADPKDPKPQADREQLTNNKEKILCEALLRHIVLCENPMAFRKIIENNISKKDKKDQKRKTTMRMGKYAQKSVEDFGQKVGNTTPTEELSPEVWYIAVLFKLFDYFNQADSRVQNELCNIIKNNLIKNNLSDYSETDTYKRDRFKIACSLYHKCPDIEKRELMQKLNAAMPDLLVLSSSKDSQFFTKVIDYIIFQLRLTAIANCFCEESDQGTFDKQQLAKEIVQLGQQSPFGVDKTIDELNKIIQKKVNPELKTNWEQLVEEIRKISPSVVAEKETEEEETEEGKELGQNGDDQSPAVAAAVEQQAASSDSRIEETTEENHQPLSSVVTGEETKEENKKEEKLGRSGQNPLPAAAAAVDPEKESSVDRRRRLKIERNNSSQRPAAVDPQAVADHQKSGVRCRRLQIERNNNSSQVLQQEVSSMMFTTPLNKENIATRFFAICGIGPKIMSEEDNVDELAKDIKLSSYSLDVLLRNVQKLKEIIEKKVNSKNYKVLQTKWKQLVKKISTYAFDSYFSKQNLSIIRAISKFTKTST